MGSRDKSICEVEGWEMELVGTGDGGRGSLLNGKAFHER